MKRLLRKSVVLALILVICAVFFAPLKAQAAPEDIPRTFSLPTPIIELIK